MRRSRWTILLGLFFTLIPSSFTPANAQRLNLENSPRLLLHKGELVRKEGTLLAQAAPDERVAADLLVRPRFRIDHSSSGGGFDGFTGVEGFVPVGQRSGNNLTYLNGRINLDNDANLGSNLILGHRFWVPKDKRVYGGYVAWDTRDTGSEFFNQVGVGIESLGDRWDWRVNSYLPVGNRRRSSGSGGPQITAVNFQNNNLLLDITDVEEIQEALGVIEAEAGVKIAEFGNGGDLRGFGGLYYLNGSEIGDTIGGRFRLQAQPIRSVSIGTGIQFDDVFGTNFLLQASISLPSSSVRSRSGKTRPDAVYHRLADSIARNNSIIVDQRRVGDGIQSDVVAVDPLTGEAYSIKHVDPLTGAPTAAGTFEAPVDTIANAVPLSSNGDIVYVQAGNAGGGFTIPDGVQVRSVGPVQTVSTQFGEVQLPGSGSGSLPTIDGGNVILSNNTMISGLEINNAPGDAISGNNLENVTIRDNQVNAALGAGIALEDVGGDVLIENNQLDDSIFDTGIFVTTGGNVVQNLTIKGNSINDNAEQGILVRATGNAQVVADIQNNAVAGNNTADPSITGVEVETSNSTPGSLCLRFDDNSSDTDSTLTLAADSQFEVVDLANVDVNNAGTVSLVDTSNTTSFEEVSSCE